MASEVLSKTGTIIVLADTTDHAPGATAQNNLGTRTDQIDLTDLADGAYRESTKFDFGGGAALWAPEWDVTVAYEPLSAPTAGVTVDYYLGFSQSATAAQDNPANLVGADGAYVGYGAAAADADEAIPQLLYVGSLVLTADADIQVSNIGRIAVPMRYGMLVVHNQSGVAHAADAVESSIRLTPTINEGQ